MKKWEADEFDPIEELLALKDAVIPDNPPAGCMTLKMLAAKEERHSGSLFQILIRRLLEHRLFHTAANI